jgi:hypothetical protein
VTGTDGWSSGYRHLQRGKASYAGVIRDGGKTKLVWMCDHSHATSVQAAGCAQRELERRVQGEREVFVLLWCKPCAQWWTLAQAGRPVSPSRPHQRSAPCPRCDFPLESVKLVVLERHPVS